MGRAALIVSGGILLSRVLGFAREVALAGLLGRSIEADLYQHAFAIPDFLFFLMAGGYLTITFVPIISRHLAEGNPQEANRSFTAVLKVVGGAMLVVTAITFILARPIAEKVFAEVSADHMDDLVRLIRIILPAQFFFVIGSLLMAVQYAHRRFVIPTLAPLIYNVGIIAGGLISWGWGLRAPTASYGEHWSEPCSATSASRSGEPAAWACRSCHRHRFDIRRSPSTSPWRFPS